jgi:hypothetical protein
MRDELNIPKNAIVFGRHGGNNTFNIRSVMGLVYDIAKNNNNIYFLFVNTQKICPDLPNIIHLDIIVNLKEKKL